MLARLAGPVVGAHLAFMAMGVTDTIMVGRFDAGALAGVALGNAWCWALLILVRGAAVGLDPLLTQAVGAGDEAGFRRALAHGMVLVTLVSLPVILLERSAGVALAAMGQPQEAIPLAANYAMTLSWAVGFIAVEAVLRQGLQARGHMRAPLVVAIAGNLLNVPLNLLCIYGLGSWGGFGAIGVAYATTTVQIAMALLTGWIAREELVRMALGLRALRLATLARVTGVAMPVALNFGLETWGFSLGLVLVGWAGATAVAAHTVALNLASLAFMVPLGISAAASTRVGNLLGAGRSWERAGWTAVGFGASVMLFSASILWFGSNLLASAYLPRPEDAAAHALAATLIPMAAAFQVFDGVQVVAFGVLRGAGDTRLPALANVVGYYVIGLPLGAVLVSRGWGAQGVWVGLSVALAIVAGMLLFRIAAVMRQGGYRREV